MNKGDKDNLPPLVVLGARMRVVREEGKISQTEMGRLLGVTKQTISQWELGKTPPQITNIIRFAAIMQVDVAALFKDISDGLSVRDKVARRLQASENLVAVYPSEADAGLAILGSEEQKELSIPLRYLSADERHDQGDFAFVVQNRAMEQRFKAGDIVTVIRGVAVEPGFLIFARVDDEFVFRRYLPQNSQNHDGATLEALNPAYPKLVMKSDDVCIGIMGLHITSRYE